MRRRRSGHSRRWRGRIGLTSRMQRPSVQSSLRTCSHQCVRVTSCPNSAGGRLRRLGQCLRRCALATRALPPASEDPRLKSCVGSFRSTDKRSCYSADDRTPRRLACSSLEWRAVARSSYFAALASALSQSATPLAASSCARRAFRLVLRYLCVGSSSADLCVPSALPTARLGWLADQYSARRVAR